MTMVMLVIDCAVGIKKVHEPKDNPSIHVIAVQILPLSQ